MSEEEKKAIDILKDYRFDFECEGKYPYLRESITTILNLIEKQQKELDKIKTLNIPIDTLIAEFERLENIEDDRDCNYISKDKIIQKIKEILKTKLMKEDSFSAECETIGELAILNELLEENNND